MESRNIKEVLSELRKTRVHLEATLENINALIFCLNTVADAKLESNSDTSVILDRIFKKSW